MNLLELHLDGNDIAGIPAGTFSTCQSLQVLSLSHNRVSALSSVSFVGLVNLRHLDLSYNEIETILSTDLDVLTKTTGRESFELLLRGNKIATIEPLSPIEFSFIDLSGNNLTSLENTFEQAASDGVVWHPDGSVSITDCDGICYLIPAVQKLDRHSRRLLERYS